MNKNKEVSTVIVVSEQSESTVKAQIGASESDVEFLFCTSEEEARSMTLALEWPIATEVLVVGSIASWYLAQILDLAEQVGIPQRRWQRDTLHG